MPSKGDREERENVKQSWTTRAELELRKRESVSEMVWRTENSKTRGSRAERGQKRASAKSEIFESGVLIVCV